MKKTLLNMALSIALSGSVLSTQAYADKQSDMDAVTNDNNNSINQSADNYMYPGMGAGAATGTLIAGPVGFIIGGLIGGLVGSSQETESPVSQSTLAIEDEPSSDIQLSQKDAVKTGLASIQVAQSGVITVPGSGINSQHDEIIDILTKDLSLDIYFRSGSTDIETFYPARLDAVAKLMKSMDQLELQLDGYADRRGDRSQNITLANQRIEKVRQQLINAGIDENRILSTAFGEMKMVSRAGDLEGYTFDRKVVISFVRSTADSKHGMTAALSAVDDKTLLNPADNVIVSPEVAKANIEF
ncbi:MAG: sortase-associated OmpA-like protein PdsO [Gammaproteobacteria bacterium]|nr:sortase-associated OmpA-like protein PdsO [Gammaproteobacteria bacterium]